MDNKHGWPLTPQSGRGDTAMNDLGSPPLDDAIEQGALFCNMLALNRAKSIN